MNQNPDYQQPEAPADSTQGWVDVKLPPPHPLQFLLTQWDVNGSVGGYTLPTSSEERKAIPVEAGCIRYFPAALASVAAISKAGNDKHNPGQPLHHSRNKSTDHGDCVLRHIIDNGDGQVGDDPFAQLEALACKAWRALAELQLFAESQGAPKAPGAK